MIPMRYVIVKKAIQVDPHHKQYGRTDPRTGKLEQIKQRGAQTQEKPSQPQAKVGETVQVGTDSVKIMAVGKHGITGQSGQGEKVQVYHGEYQKVAPQGKQAPPQGQKQATPGSKGAMQVSPTPEIPEHIRSAAHLSWDYASFIKQLESDKAFTDKVGTDIFFDKPEIKNVEHYYGEGPDTPVSIEMTARDKDGNRIGDFDVHFDKIKNEAYIASVKVSDEHQGKGFGTAVVDKIIDFSKERGMQKVTLIADGESGVYAWSMSGFDFDPDDPDGKGDMIHNFVNWLRREKDNFPDIQQFEHPWDVASYKVGDDKVGKEWMLGPGHTDHFMTEMDLVDPNSFGYEINQKYRELRGRPSKPIEGPPSETALKFESNFEKPTDKKPAEKPSEAKPSEAKPSEAKPTEEKPAEKKNSTKVNKMIENFKEDMERAIIISTSLVSAFKNKKQPKDQKQPKDPTQDAIDWIEGLHPDASVEEKNDFRLEAKKLGKQLFDESLKKLEKPSEAKQ